MSQTIITAGDASAGLVQSAGNDGTLVLQSGAAGSKVNALSFAADGTPTLIKPLVLVQANQATLPAAASLISFTHGLGVVPVSAELEIVCLTAELGYSVGDVVTPITSANVSYPQPFAIRKTATVVDARVGSNNPWVIINYTTGAAANPTLANWAWRFKVRTA